MRRSVHPMRKRTISAAAPERAAAGGEWLPLGQLAAVELTSESETHPVEAALDPEAIREGVGWRATEPGPQVIRLQFDAPRTVRRVRLVFEERERSRTQEFVLRWQPAGATVWREAVRQQFNFNPGGASREEEDYQVDFPAAAALELRIVPDVSGGDALASLREFRVA
jgi:hypothetical protein